MPRGNLKVFVQTRGWKLVYALVPLGIGVSSTLMESVKSRVTDEGLLPSGW